MNHSLGQKILIVRLFMGCIELATYFEFINDKNKTSIDDKISRYALKIKTTLYEMGAQVIEYWYAGGYRDYPQTAMGIRGSLSLSERDLVFFQLPEDTPFGCVATPKRTSSLYYLELVSIQHNELSSSALINLAKRIKVYVFSPNQDGGNQNYGLEIFNENGTKIFHSQLPCLNIVGQKQYKWDDATGTSAYKDIIGIDVNDNIAISPFVIPSRDLFWGERPNAINVFAGIGVYNGRYQSKLTFQNSDNFGRLLIFGIRSIGDILIADITNC